jgi:hypothetical protein
MSPFLRGMLFGVGLVGAFVGGYFLKNPPSVAKAAAETPVVAEKPRPASASVKTTSGGPAQPATPVIDFFDPPLLPPLPPVKAAGEAPLIDFSKLPPPLIGKDEPISPNDIAFQLIKKQIGINTSSLLKEPEAMPSVLSEARLGPTPRLAPPPEFNVVSRWLPPTRQVYLRGISLDFEMTRLGTGKVIAVELWTTRDLGATWERTDSMEGCLPPFRTRLWSEGMYGFRLVFESETGLKTPTPKPGDVPELIVELVGPPLRSPNEPVLPEGKLTDVRSEDEGPEMGPMPRTVN